MQEYISALHKEGKPNPFKAGVKECKVLQGRILSGGGDLLQVDEQWAQITTKMHFDDDEQFTIWERKFSDKTNFLDWKLAWLFEPNELLLLHSHSHSFQLLKLRKEETI